MTENSVSTAMIQHADKKITCQLNANIVQYIIVQIITQ
jgi:hypothetical protein